MKFPKGIMSMALCLTLLASGMGFAGCDGGAPSGTGPETPGTQTPETPVPGGDETPDVGGEGEEDAPKLKAPEQIVKDPKFTNGFGVKAIDGAGRVDGTIGAEEGKEYSYTWTLAQWYCGYFYREGGVYPERFDLLKGTRTQNGSIVNWADASKTFRVNFDEGSAYMKLEATKEYTGARREGQPWPHLLLEYSTEQKRVLDLSSLTLKMKYTLKTIKGDMGAETNKDMHCAQFPYYLVVRNCNRESEGYGEYIWFGGMLYDNRYEFTMTYATADLGSGDKGGTGAFIYTPGSQAFLSNPVQVGEETVIEWDMLPYIKTAFETAQSKGYMTKTKFEDLRVTGGNFGWEITGTYDAAIQVDQFEIWAIEFAEEET